MSDPVMMEPSRADPDLGSTGKEDSEHRSVDIAK